MVTFAQAQERAEEWINGDVPGYQHREVRVREFDLGFVVWAEDRQDGPVSDGGAQRLVIARDSGEATLWPSLPVGEVIRRYEEEYGLPDAAPQDAAPPPVERVDLNQTSFLLSPPEWLQEAADKMGIPDRRSGVSAADSDSAADADSDADSAAGTGAGAGEASGAGSPAPPAPTDAGAPLPPAAPGGGTPWPEAGGQGDDDEPAWDDSLAATSAGTPAGATPWAGTDTNADPAEDHSVPLPATVFSPPLSSLGEDDTPPPGVAPDAKTALMHGGSHLPATAIAPALDGPATPAPSAGPAAPPPPTGAPTPPPPGGGASAYGYPQGPGAAGPQGAVGVPGASDASGAADGNRPQPPAGAPTPPPGPDASAYGYPQGAPGGPGAAGVNAPRPPAGSPVPSASGADASAFGYPQGASGAPGAADGNPPQPPAGSPTPPPGPDASAYGYPQGAPGAPGAPGAAGVNAPPPPAGSPVPPPGADASAYGYPQGPGAVGGATPPPVAPPGATPPPPSGPGAPGTPAGGYVPTQLVSSLGPDGQPPAAPAAPGAPGTPPGGVHHAATMFADPSLGGPGGIKPPGAPQPPGPPGAPQPPGPPGAPGTPPGGVHHAATMFADPSLGGPGGIKPPGAPQPPGPPGAPGAPQPPGPPGAPGAPQPPGPPGGGVHHAATMLAGPAVGGPGGPGMPPPPAPVQPGPPGQPYGYPQPPTAQPTVGPGYQAVLRYRAADGSEQQLIRRSAPGTPHPEWQILHELRGMNVPPQQVLELHTELESCELPGAYCARMIRETWPQARITSIAPYGRDHASRQQGMRELIAHQGELHQVADGPARPAPVRAPLQQMPPAPPIPPEGVAQELAGAFGPGIFRFDQRAVSRQGVPDIVAHTLVVAGLPVDFGPFFWAQAQPGRPVPTLAELAQERGVQPASDAGSYLVMGSDFGRALCVQYGTAHIVAVPVEAGPGGAPVPPQFVNTGLPEFARCMALLGRMWRLRFGLNQEQAGRWTVDFQNQLAALDPAALASPESWWSVLLEQMWDGLL
ncbi:SUKH-4 family immunity protein [Streptomyces sp. NPDC018584]|uniref:SUKH-4 family immunity protein n=1 Tax=unclassified Streptomyces TaxID=2593676 RepID=UPI0037B99F56